MGLDFSAFTDHELGFFERLTQDLIQRDHAVELLNGTPTLMPASALAIVPVIERGRIFAVTVIPSREWIMGIDPGQGDEAPVQDAEDPEDLPFDEAEGDGDDEGDES